MNLQNRINLLSELGFYLQKNTAEWQQTKEKAGIVNGWFTPEFIDLATNNIVTEFLTKDKLEDWANHYHLDDNISPKNVGIVMAGNIPLVGFHDLLCVFICGHKQTIKLSSKDNILLPHLIEKMIEIDPAVKDFILTADMLKGCDAYIATGSNNSARYFDQYFGKYPSIIRRNRTSIAILTGDESKETLEKLADDIHSFFGLGCRNVTKIFVPNEYDFVPLLQSFHRYKYFSDHNKYRNNYDYNLSMQIMNNRFYMTNEATLLVESDAIFSPISQLNYSFYTDKEALLNSLKNNDDIQCIAGDKIPFGAAQKPSLTDYADGVDTVVFLLTL
ncbi:acyl-CoA reductase [Ferruginibacter sp. SUN002]|uniref:acyl-CoA reductase n=1 Tax=Ferruginibacter sp. SUN002 TaxID=2937789 RepID=UPI003D3624BA